MANETKATPHKGMQSKTTIKQGKLKRERGKGGGQKKGGKKREKREENKTIWKSVAFIVATR